MEHKDLTNEKLLKKFKSQFELVDHAINIAVHMVKSGKEGRGKTENQNVALEVLEDLNDQADPNTLREFFRVKSEVIPEDLEIDFIKF
jgi:hypothetical protein